MIDLYASCLFLSAKLVTIERKYGANPTDEKEIEEVGDIAQFFFGQMEPHLAHAYPMIAGVIQ